MQFTRSSGKRFYKRLFLVGVEGMRTECDYFSRFNSAYVHVIPVASKGGNSPKKVLSTLKAEIPRYQLRDGDYLWIVVDRDEWPEAEIELCRKWAQDPKESPGQYKGFSLSNPKFEFWLLCILKTAFNIRRPRRAMRRCVRICPSMTNRLDGLILIRHALMTRFNEPRFCWDRTILRTGHVRRGKRRFSRFARRYVG